MAELTGRPLVHPIHAILLAFPVALFAGVVVADIAYLNTAEIQWSNFAAWLNAWGMVFTTVVLVWAGLIFAAKRNSARRRSALAYFLLLAGAWVVGFVNAFHHARDGWSSVGAGGLVLSLACAGLTIAAAWFGHSSREVVR